MRKPRICVISFGSIENKSNGYQIRSYHMVKSLALSNFGNVLVLEFSKEIQHDLVNRHKKINFIHLRWKKPSENGVLRLLGKTLTFEPFSAIKFQLFSLIELILFRNYIKVCDVVFVEGALIPFGIILPKVFRKKVVVDTHCINKLLTLHYKNRNLMIYFVRKILWDLLERFATKVSDLVIVVSNQEKNFVQKEYGISRSKITVIPHVVDMPETKCSEEEISKLRKKWRLENKIVVTFVGNLQSVQNRDAVEYVINELASFFWRKRRDVVFLIIGEGKENFRPNFPNVVFTGFVENLASFLEISDVCIAPLRVGAGIKTKVLTYMVYGKPVVTTPIGFEGIKAEKSNSVIITDIIHFSDTLLKALDTLDDLEEKARNNRSIAKSMYSPDMAKQELKKVLKYAKM